MAKDMSFKDKANLLFADHNHKCESPTKERLLTPEEEEAIVADCEKKRQLDKLNYLTRCFNVIHHALVDVRTRAMCLELALSRIDTLVLGIYFKQHAKDAINRVTSKKERAKLDEEHLLSGIEDVYAWFHPAQCDREDDFEAEMECYRTREPNIAVQRHFEDALVSYKALKQALYIVDKLIEKGEGVEFLSEQDKKTLLYAEGPLQTFEKSGGFTGVIQIYENAHELSMMRKEGFTVPAFEELVFDREKALKLKPEEIEEAERVLNAAL